MSRAVVVIFSALLLDATVFAASISSKNGNQPLAPGPQGLFTCPRPYGQFAAPSCSQFYNCWEGRYYLQDCPKDLYFNPNQQWCDWPENVNCADRGNPSGGPIQPGTPGPPGLYTCPQPNGRFMGPTCSQFYDCLDGRYFLRDCPKDLYFNKDIQCCDWPQNVNCARSGSTTRAPVTTMYTSIRPTVTPGPVSTITPTRGPIPTGTPVPGGYTCPRPTGQFSAPNCNQFYNCWEGNYYLQTCPKDLYFNPDKMWCDWPENVACAPKGTGTTRAPGQTNPGQPGGYTCPRPTGQFSAPNCNQFYNCWEGNYYLQDCPKDLYFNPDKMWCDWPENVACAPKGTGTTRGPGQTNPGQPGGYTCPRPTGQFSAPNCNQFYNCWEGNYYLQTCQKDLYFNPDKMWCDWPENVACAPKGSTVSGPGQTVTPGQPGLFNCPQPTGQFPGPICSQYYDCLNGRSYLRDCPKDLYFNPAKQCCDWPENTNCGGTVSTTRGPVSTVTTPSTRPTETLPSNWPTSTTTTTRGPIPTETLPSNWPTSTSTTTRGQVVTVTPGPSGQYTCPRPTGQFSAPNCNQFYNCWEGNYYLQNCPKDLYFNPDKMWCDWPENVACAPQGTPTRGPGQTNPGQPGGYTCPRPTGQFSAPNCNQFYNCWEGNYYLQNCPKDLYFNPDKMWCDWPENVACAPKGSTISGPGQTVTPGQPGLFNCPQPTGQFPGPICSQYYDCLNGRSYLRDCPKDLYFNPAKQCCDWPQNVNCGGSTSTLPVTTATTTTTTMPVTTTTQSTRPVSTTTTTTVPPETLPSNWPTTTMMTTTTRGPVITTTSGLFTCPQPTGQFPGPICSQYYDCLNGRYFLRDCPKDLYFNPAKQCCDWPQNTNCGGSVLSTTRGPTVTQGPGGQYTCPRPTGQFSAPNCNQFYNCWEGNYYLQTCPKDLYFNPDKMWCDWPENVACAPKGTGTTRAPGQTNPGQQGGYTCPRPTGQFSAPNCNQFYNCWEGNYYLQTCPKDLYFNPDKMWCDWPENVACAPKGITNSGPVQTQTTTRGPVPPGTPVPPGGYTCPRPTGQFPAPNCNQFYNCWDGRSYLQDCPKDLYFNPDKQCCDWPQNVACAPKPPTSSGPVQTPATTRGPVPTVTSRPPGLYTCPQPNGRFVGPNCSQYYDCLSGNYFLRDCPKDLYFNKDTQCCDWPQNVNCAGMG